MASANDGFDCAINCHSHLYIFLTHVAVNKLSALGERSGWKAS